MRVRVLKDWTQSYDPALKVARGDRLLVVREDDSKWSGWVWCTEQNGLLHILNKLPRPLD